MLQILSQNHARVRHYKYLKEGKPQFEYHRQNIEYVKRNLNEKNFNVKPNPANY